MPTSYSSSSPDLHHPLLLPTVYIRHGIITSSAFRSNASLILSLTAKYGANITMPSAAIQAQTAPSTQQMAAKPLSVVAIQTTEAGNVDEDAGEIKEIIPLMLLSHLILIPIIGLAMLIIRQRIILYTSGSRNTESCGRTTKDLS